MIKLCQAHLTLFMNVIMDLCAFSKYSYLLGTVQFSFFFFFAWWCLTTFASKKIHAPFLQIRLIIAMKELTTRFINFTLKVLYSPVHL